MKTIQNVKKVNFSLKDSCLIEMGICSVIILYMQYSKFKWIVSDDGSDMINYLQYYFSEIYIVFLLLFAGFLFSRRALLYSIFLVYYYVSIFNFISWFVQGRPFAFFDVHRSVQLFLFYPEFLAEIEPVLKIKIGFFILLPLIAVFFVRIIRASTWSLQLRSCNNFVRLGTVFIALGVLLFPAGIYAHLFRYSTLGEVVGNSWRDIKIRLKSSRPDEAYKLLGVSREQKDQGLWQFSSKNVLIFIIETAPYEFYPSLEELCSMTGNGWLKEHGRIYTQHYATYPESERAIFSIISGKYPPLENGDGWKRIISHSGLAQFFNNQGYSTYFLGTAPLEFHDDREMIERLGFGNIYDVKETLSARRIVDGKIAWDRTKIYHFDNLLKEKAIGIIASHRPDKDTRPFFMVLAPQSSHAPFQTPPGYQLVQDDKDKIKLNSIWQFKLLKSLIEELKNTEQLNDTVIIVTGDHGIRSKYESILFADSKILQSISFHVPLIISSSEIEHSIVDDYITSHVDIAPTIISAFKGGINHRKYHGIDLFSREELPKRSVFLFGGGSLPVSGMINNKGYFMENKYLGLCFINNMFDFSVQSGRKKLNGPLKKEILDDFFVMYAFLDINSFHD